MRRPTGVYGKRIEMSMVNQIRYVQNSVDSCLDVLMEHVTGITICSANLMTEWDKFAKWEWKVLIECFFTLLKQHSSLDSFSVSAYSIVLWCKTSSMFIMGVVWVLKTYSNIPLWTETTIISTAVIVLIMLHLKHPIY